MLIKCDNFLSAFRLSHVRQNFTLIQTIFGFHLSPPQCWALQSISLETWHNWRHVTLMFTLKIYSTSTPRNQRFVFYTSPHTQTWSADAVLERAIIKFMSLSINERHSSSPPLTHRLPIKINLVFAGTCWFHSVARVVLKRPWACGWRRRLFAVCLRFIHPQKPFRKTPHNVHNIS